MRRLSESHWANPVRTCVDAWMSGSSNMALASTAPAQQPAICATMKAIDCSGRISPRHNATSVTTGLKCAPLIGPNKAINVASAATVAPVFASNAIASVSTREALAP